jgi:hypothetical protein
MSSYSDSYSTTFTTADIGKVFDCFAADYDMVSQSTGLHSREYAKSISGDVKIWAQHGYLDEVSICLQNSAKEIIRAAKYEISTDAGLWTAQRPGNNLWPRVSGGNLRIILNYSEKWHNLSDQQKTTFRTNQLNESWVSTDIDTSFPSLSKSFDRNYVSNGYGVRKSTYA